MKILLKVILTIIPILHFSQSVNEFDIYSKLISENISKTKKTITLQKQTHTLSSERIDDLKYKNLKFNFKTLSKETFDNFIAKNKTESLLTNKFDKNLNVNLIDKNEITEIVKPPSGWDNFYKKYKNSIGILEFSKVGFNKDGTQAFFYYSKMSGFLNGSGHYALYEKKNGKWKMILINMAWIS